MYMLSGKYKNFFIVRLRFRFQEKPRFFQKIYFPRTLYGQTPFLLIRFLWTLYGFTPFPQTLYGWMPFLRFLWTLYGFTPFPQTLYGWMPFLLFLWTLYGFTPQVLFYRSPLSQNMMSNCFFQNQQFDIYLRFVSKYLSRVQEYA